MSAVVAVSDDKTDKPWEVCCELSIAEQWEGNHTIYIPIPTCIPTLPIYNLSVPVHRQKPLSHSVSTGIGTIHTTRFHFHAILNEERSGNALFSSPYYVNNELILNPLLLQMRVEQYIPDTTLWI